MLFIIETLWEKNLAGYFLYTIAHTMVKGVFYKALIG